MRSLLLALALLALPACTSWRSTSADAVSANEPSRVRVTTTEGSRYTLYNATVRGDSLYGRTEVGTDVAVAVADLDRAETRRFSAVKTAGAAVGGVIAAGALYLGAIVVYLVFGGSTV